LIFFLFLCACYRFTSWRFLPTFRYFVFSLSIRCFLLFTSSFILTDPLNFHLFPSSIFKEKFFCNVLMCIFGSKTYNFKIWCFAIESWPYTFSFKWYFKVLAIVDNNVKSILKFHYLICITNNFNLSSLIWLQNSMSLNDLPDAFFLFSKSSVFSLNLWIICDF
jgi:hypothetical protein